MLKKYIDNSFTCRICNNFYNHTLLVIYEKMFESGSIGSLKLKNRTVFPGVATGFAEWTGEVSADLIAYFEERAKSGVALIITEFCSIDSELGKATPHQLAIDDLRHISGFEKLAAALHQHGTKLFVQLFHPGVQTSSMVLGGKQIIAPSQIKNQAGEVAHELTEEECRVLVARFVKGAVNARIAGVDGVEIHGAHGYLINQFLSPYTNKRTDRYGGDLNGRMQFISEIIAGVRKSCGPDFPISVRISVEEFVDGGLTLEESVIIAQRLEALGVDALNVTVAIGETKQYFMESYFFKEGWRENYAKTIKSAVNLPVISVNTIKHLDYAEDVLKRNVCDFVAVARAQIADPEWVKKGSQGRDKEVCVCIGCLYCLKEFGSLRRIKCAVNPVFGRELVFSDLRKTGNGRRVVVVGGGPSGMVAAGLLEKRGFEVILTEKTNRLGGMLNYADKGMSKTLISEYCEFLITQIRNANIEVCLETETTPDSIHKYDPYAVILATGGCHPAKMSGSKRDNVYRWDGILSGNVTLKNQKVVVVGGGLTGLETAEFLSEDELGNKVTVIEMKDEIAADVYLIIKNQMLHKLSDRSVVLHSKTRLTGIKDSHILCETDGAELSIACDSVVLAQGIFPDPSIFDEYKKAGIKTLYIVGDALNSGTIADAVRTGYECAYYLD